MRMFFSFLLLLIMLKGNSTVYYFAASGNDYNAGTMAMPWQTVHKFNAMVFKPGDVALFKRGDTFHGGLITHGSGTVDKPVLIGAYGSGASPVISGFTSIAKWYYAGPGIYKTKSLNAASALRLVTMDGVVTGQGRYPNADAPNNGYLMYESFNNAGASITDNELSSTAINASWAGAELKVRSNHSALDAGVIKSIAGNVITYDNSDMFCQPWLNNYGYFITNSIKTLDQVGEWYYSEREQCLYMYFGSDNPDKHRVQLSLTDTLLNPQGSNYVVRDIDFMGANKFGVCSYWQGVTGLTIKNCGIAYCGSMGIALIGRANFWLDSSKVAYCGVSGVNLPYRNEYARVTNSVINEVGEIPAMLYRDANLKRVGFGLYSDQQENIGLTAVNNRIRNIGYMGICVQRNNNLIYNNLIDSTCGLLDDGGGIYAGNYERTPQRGNVIKNNIVLHTLGAPAGTEGYVMGNGIYLDDGCNNFMVSNNTVAYSGQFGVFLHNSRECSMLNNAIVFSGIGPLSVQANGYGDNLAVYGLQIQFNVLVSGPQRLCYYLYSTGGPDRQPAMFGKIDSNYLCHLYTPYVCYFDDYSVPGVAIWDAGQWQLNTGLDKHSKQVQEGDSIVLCYAVDKDSTILVPGQYLRVDGNIIQNSIRVPAHSGVILFRKPIATDEKTGLITRLKF